MEEGKLEEYDDLTFLNELDDNYIDLELIFSNMSAE